MYSILVFLSITSIHLLSTATPPSILPAAPDSIKAIISITTVEKVSSHKRCIYIRYDTNGDDDAMLLFFLVDYDDLTTKQGRKRVLVNNKDIEVGWVRSRTKRRVNQPYERTDWNRKL